MNCNSAAKLFSKRIENRLHPQQREQLQSHLSGCPDCSELLEAMELNMLQLQSVPEPPLPDGLQQRLFAIPLREQAMARTAGGAGGGWLFSNAAAAVILGLFITANLTWFNPEFRDSIRGCRQVISQRSAQVRQLAADWGAGLGDLKRQVESGMDAVRNADAPAATDTDQNEGSFSGSLTTGIIRVLGLISA